MKLPKSPWPYKPGVLICRAMPELLQVQGRVADKMIFRFEADLFGAEIESFVTLQGITCSKLI